MSNSRPGSPTTEQPIVQNNEQDRSVLVPNATSATDTVTQPLLSSAATQPTTEGGTFEKTQELAKKVVQADLDSPVVDVGCSALLGGLCFVHPCVSLGVAAGVDMLVAIARKLCGKQPNQSYTVFTSNAIDAYTATRSNQPMHANVVVPCGPAGAVPAMIVNLFKGPIPQTTSATNNTTTVSSVHPSPNSMA